MEIKSIINLKQIMKVKSVLFNWHQAGSVNDRDGAGESWDKVCVGEKGIISIEENEPHNGLQQWNYIVNHEDGTKARIFNANYVEYYK